MSSADTQLQTHIKNVRPLFWHSYGTPERIFKLTLKKNTISPVPFSGDPAFMMNEARK